MVGPGKCLFDEDLLLDRHCEERSNRCTTDKSGDFFTQRLLRSSQ